MENEIGNCINLLQSINNPKNPNFYEANKTISQLMMEQNPNFLQTVIHILLNVDLPVNESFYALSIIKEYFKNSIVFDKFHSEFPSSFFSEDQIHILQTIAYKFFKSKEPFLRNNAADLYFQAIKVYMSHEYVQIPKFIEKLANESTTFEEVLSIMELFCLIFSEIEIPEQGDKLFIILLNLLSKFSSKEEFISLLFRLLSKFDFPVFHLISDNPIFNNFIVLTIQFYQQNPALKIDIINFLLSESLEKEVFLILIDKILPLMLEDLGNINPMTRNIVLTILNFLESILVRDTSNFINIFMAQFLNPILSLSQQFNIDEDPQYFVADEWEVFNAAQLIIEKLLANHEFSTIIFNSILPFIQEGLQSDDLRFKSVSMLLLGYAFQSIDKEVIRASIPFEAVFGSISKTINSKFCRVRSYCIQLLYHSFSFYRLEIALPFINNLFQLISDCDPIALDAISVLVLIGTDPNFTMLDQFFSQICSILCANDGQQLFNQSPTFSDFVNVLIFPQTHKQFTSPVIEFLLSFLGKSLAVPNEMAEMVNRQTLHCCCSIISYIITNVVEQATADYAKSIINLAIALFRKFMIGTDLFMILFFIKKHKQVFLEQLGTMVELAVAGLANSTAIFSFSCFVSFPLTIEKNFDLSPFEVNLTQKLIELFLASQSFDVKNSVLVALADLAKSKPERFSPQLIECSMGFFKDLSENVYNIYHSFLDACIPFYRNACTLYRRLIMNTEFRNCRYSFLLVNMLIAKILDFDSLSDQIFKSLMKLFQIFSEVYKPQLNELMSSQLQYMEMYVEFNQRIKLFLENKMAVEPQEQNANLN